MAPTKRVANACRSSRASSHALDVCTRGPHLHRHQLAVQRSEQTAAHGRVPQRVRSGVQLAAEDGGEGGGAFVPQQLHHRCRQQRIEVGGTPSAGCVVGTDSCVQLQTASTLCRSVV